MAAAKGAAVPGAERKPRLDLLTQGDLFLRPGMPLKPGTFRASAASAGGGASPTAGGAAGGAAGADGEAATGEGKPGQCKTPPALQAIIDRAKLLATKSIIPEHLLNGDTAQAEDLDKAGEKSPADSPKRGKKHDVKLAFPEDSELVFFEKQKVVQAGESTGQEETAEKPSREWTNSAECVADFPDFLGELAELCRTLSVVLSSRCDYLRQKLKEDPNCLKQGSTSYRLMLQLGTAAQNGVYVLQKANFLLRLHFTDDEDLRKPSLPLALDEENDTADDLLRCLHTNAAKVNTLMETLLFIVPRVSRSPNQERKKGGSMKQQKEFAMKFMAALGASVENGFQPRKRKITKKAQKEAKLQPAITEALTTIITQDDFDLTMQQLYGLTDHFQLLISKSSTVARLLDTKLKGASAMAMGIMVILAIARAQRNWRKRKAAEKAAAAEAAAAGKA
ncbi:unnamed protein product [Amoebophrya sp. A120]|nr:unnamed protein product [Amoebophrya sp. A120]|eukprot:GSA120T00012823001.1